jgi:BirA family biotin operon repressor/biotin-[acetyl-CoA-carboxylase] ligase
MPLRTGLAAARAIESVTNVRLLIKWPNDLVLRDARKVGGILCEGATAQAGPWLVAGIGINVHQSVSDFPPELRAEAASLRMAGAPVERPLLVRALLDALRPFAVVPPPLDGAFLEELAARDALAGQKITVDGEPAGIARAIGPDAALIIETPRGIRSIRNGTVRTIHNATIPAPTSYVR